MIVRGIVQGVGFRPFVYGLATDLGLAGFVRNETDRVLIEVEGATTDGDTPISRQALIDLMEMQFANPKGLRIIKVDAQEA